MQGESVRRAAGFLLFSAAPASRSIELQMINLEAKEPVINELMVEIPMFSLCDVRALKLALTACLSGPQLASLRGKKRKKREASSMRVSVSVRAWIWKKLAHRRKISDFLW